MDEADLVRQRYAKRRARKHGNVKKFSILNAYNYLVLQERQRAIIRWIKAVGVAPLSEKTLLEIGCGECGNLRRFIDLGFDPHNLVGNDLREELLAAQRPRLPSGVTLYPGDASKLNLPAASFDIVLQATVFSSLLDDEFQRRLAQSMWSWVKPGGGILWYDFVYNNFRNPDVRGVGVRRIRELFPEGEIRLWRLTLAPPIGRLVTKIWPGLYGVFNAIPFLRTHAFCWIKKPAASREAILQSRASAA